MLAGYQVAGPDQIYTMIGAAVNACEQYYPAIQLVTWAEKTPKQALEIAIAGAYWRA